MIRLHPAIVDTRAVLFDFDFTLADSSVGIMACVRYALEEMGLPDCSDDRILKTVGLYLPETLVALHGENQRARGVEFLGLFTEKADQVMEDGTRLFPDAAATLRAVKSLGLPIGIVSTKYRYRIESILDSKGLLDTVDGIVGGEDVSRHKPDPEGLLTAARMLGVSLSDVVYVGDSEVDARAAHSAGMPFVGVLSGTTTADTLSAYPHRAMLESVGELIEGNVC